MKPMMTLFGVTAALTLAATADVRELTLGMQDNEASNVYLGAQEFASKLDDLSGGELTINMFPSSTLGDFKAMAAQVQAGELDMVVTGYPDMSYVIPELNLIGAPYAATDFANLEKIVAGDWGQEMAAKFEAQGVHLLDVWYCGTRQTTSNRAIESIDDMKGLRLRTPNVPFLIAHAEAVGATPAPVAFAEVYLALQTNQVDAEENPLPTIEARKFYEVQSHVALPNHFVASAAVQVSNDLRQGPSNQERGRFQQAVEAGGDVNDAATATAEADLIATFEGRGLTITRSDLAPFKAAMQPYCDTLEAEFGEGAIARVTGE